MNIVNSPSDMVQLFKECIRVTYRWIDICNLKYEMSMPHYRVTFTLRSGVAGRAHLSQGRINFNPTLLRENPEAFLARTPGHEVAHFVAYFKFKDGGHGMPWHRVMRELGLKDTRCHTFDTSRCPTKIGKIKQAPKTIKTEVGQIRPIGIGKVIEFD